MGRGIDHSVESLPTKYDALGELWSVATSKIMLQYLHAESDPI